MACDTFGFRRVYTFTQLVAPRAVTMAVAIDAMICTINLMVSFLLMVYLLSSSRLPYRHCHLSYLRRRCRHWYCHPDSDCYRHHCHSGFRY